MRGFIAFAASHGLIIDRLYPKEAIRRCPTEAHPHKRNGAFFYDGTRGWVQSWEADQQVHWWNDPDAKPWTEADKREFAEKKRKADLEKAKRQREAASLANAMIRLARQDTHEYLKSKALGDVRVLVLDDCAELRDCYRRSGINHLPGFDWPQDALLVPMRDCVSGDLLGVQVISLIANQWHKFIPKGQRAKGAVFVIGPRNVQETILCEGYATGLSIHEALLRMSLRTSVTVCFSAGNMVTVAERIRSRKLVFADHDASQTGEKIAQAIGVPYVMSDTVGQDANDLHQQRGILALQAKIMELRTKSF